MNDGPRAPKSGVVSQYRVDHERLRAIVRADREGNLPAVQRVASGHLPSGLIDHGSALAQFAGRGAEHQVAGLAADRAGAFELEADAT